MDLGEYIFMRIALVFLILFIIVAVRFLLYLIRKGLNALLKRNSAPKQAAQRPVPKSVTPAPKKEETVFVPVPGRTSSGEVPPEGTIPLGQQRDSAVRPQRYYSHQLRALSGEHQGKTFPLYEMQENTIGRNPQCGYENGLCDPPGWWLSPGTILKGRYMVGRHLTGTPEELCYLGWDLGTDTQVEIVEFYAEAMVTRDITHCEAVSCLPGKEHVFETGKQNLFEKAKLYYNCVSRVNTVVMDFFVRNHTCYYVRERP